MSGFDQEQKDLVFQYCLGLSASEEAARTEQLLARNDEAAKSHARISGALAPLQTLSPPACPGALSDRTVERLRELAREHLASAPPPPKILKLARRQNLSNVIAVAASVLLIVGILIPSSKLMRHRSGLRTCEGQLANISRGLELYSADHEDRFPVMARAADAPWNRIGHPGPENHSNTRNPFRLLTLGYLDRAEDFVCCGGKRGYASPLTPSQIKAHNDFPSRDHITYSYRVPSDPFLTRTSLSRLPIMADMNPHFEQSAACTSARVTLRLDPDRLRLNSPNHARRGQNVLYGGGHVRYSRTRFLDDPTDDIYLPEGTDDCCGVEVPGCLTDTLLGP
ncbi:MAG: hypothetical protein JW741_01835 [Sedimentisphaerales bacterium]|nr:hypothetical protein [Sedimentisphaerales bacterium]